MTLVLIGKDLALEGLTPKMEDKQVPGKYTSQIPKHSTQKRWWPKVKPLKNSKKQKHWKLSKVENTYYIKAVPNTQCITMYYLYIWVV